MKWADEDSLYRRPGRPNSSSPGVLHTGDRLTIGIREAGSYGLCFYVERSGRVALSRRAEIFPLSDDGWKAAWDTFSGGDLEGSSAYLRLEDARVTRAKQQEVRYAANKQASATSRQRASALAGEERLATIGGCQIHAAYGSHGFKVDEVCALHFLETKLVILGSVLSRRSVEMRYDNILNLYVDGPGAVTTGGGFIGGGFGIKAAAEGMLIASLLNKLTTRTTVTTFIEAQDDSSHFVWVTSYRPDQLNLALKGPLAKIRVAQQRSGIGSAASQASHTDPAAPTASTRSDLVGDLQRLAELHAAGVLTDDEFTAAKAKVGSAARSGDS